MLFKMGHYFAGWGFKIIFETTPLRNANRWLLQPSNLKTNEGYSGIPIQHEPTIHGIRQGFCWNKKTRL